MFDHSATQERERVNSRFVKGLTTRRRGQEKIRPVAAIVRMRDGDLFSVGARRMRSESEIDWAGGDSRSVRGRPFFRRNQSRLSFAVISHKAIVFRGSEREITAKSP